VHACLLFNVSGISVCNAKTLFFYVVFTFMAVIFIFIFKFPAINDQDLLLISAKK